MKACKSGRKFCPFSSAGNCFPFSYWYDYQKIMVRLSQNMNLAVVAAAAIPCVLVHCSISKASFHPTRKALHVESINLSETILFFEFSPSVKGLEWLCWTAGRKMLSSALGKDIFLPAGGWRTVCLCLCVFLSVCNAVSRAFFSFAGRPSQCLFSPLLIVTARDHVLISGPSPLQLAATHNSKGWFCVIWQRALRWHHHWPLTKRAVMCSHGKTLVSFECDNASLLHVSVYRPSKYATFVESWLCFAGLTLER